MRTGCALVGTCALRTEFWAGQAGSETSSMIESLLALHAHVGSVDALIALRVAWVASALVGKVLSLTHLAVVLGGALLATIGADFASLGRGIEEGSDGATGARAGIGALQAVWHVA